MKEKKMSKDEMRWLAQDDANIMARYQEILKDKSRLNRAVKEAERQANDLQKRANNMKTVARGRKSK